MRIGGEHQFPFRVKPRPRVSRRRCVHSDQTGRHTTNPCGGGATLGGKTVYHYGDTGLMLEMQLLARQVDAMLVPIGDTYTMRIAVRALEFVQPRTVIPMHGNTFDLITADPADCKRQVGRRAPIVLLESGQAHTLA